MYKLKNFNQIFFVQVFAVQQDESKFNIHSPFLT